LKLKNERGRDEQIQSCEAELRVKTSWERTP